MPVNSVKLVNFKTGLTGKTVTSVKQLKLGHWVNSIKQHFNPLKWVKKVNWLCQQTNVRH